MRMEIGFDMNNAAFEDDLRGFEVSRILKKIADYAEQGIDSDFSGNIKDINGNTVGEFSVDLTAQEYQDSLCTDDDDN